MYEVRITPEGRRHLDRLPQKVRAAAIEATFATIAEDPQRAGKPLLGELEGLRSARRGDYRVPMRPSRTALTSARGPLARASIRRSLAQEPARHRVAQQPLRPVAVGAGQGSELVR